MKRKLIIGFEPRHGGEDALSLGRVLSEVLASAPVVFTVLPLPSHLAGSAEFNRQAEDVMKPSFDVIRDEWRDPDLETRAVPSDSPAGALEALAQSEGADLIVIGSCHRGPAGRLLMGSVGESLASGSRHAIAIAPRGYRGRREHRLQRVAVAFDGSPEAWTGLETGIALAERCHGTVAAITVADFPHYGYATTWSVLTTGEIKDAEHTEKQRVLDLATERIPPAVAGESRLLTGVSSALLTEVSSEFDLVIAGSRSYGPLRRTILGSTTRPLVRSANAPVLILPRGTGVDPLGLGVERAAGSSAAVSS